MALTREPSRKPGIDHRARLVDAAADRADDALDDLHQVAVVAKEDVGQFEPAVALDVDLVETVDEDVGDVLVAQQRFERTEAEELVEDVDDQRFALGQASGVVSLLRSTSSRMIRRISGSASFCPICVRRSRFSRLSRSLWILAFSSW